MPPIPFIQHNQPNYTQFISIPITQQRTQCNKISYNLLKSLQLHHPKIGSISNFNNSNHYKISFSDNKTSIQKKSYNLTHQSFSFSKNEIEKTFFDFIEKTMIPKNNVKITSTYLHNATSGSEITIEEVIVYCKQTINNCIIDGDGSNLIITIDKSGIITKIETDWIPYYSILIPTNAYLEMSKSKVAIVTVEKITDTLAIKIQTNK